MSDEDRAFETIRRAQRDLGRALSDGERRDLLKDHTDWTSEHVAELVEAIRQRS